MLEPHSKAFHAVLACINPSLNTDTLCTHPPVILCEEEFGVA